MCCGSHEGSTLLYKSMPRGSSNNYRIEEKTPVCRPAILSLTAAAMAVARASVQEFQLFAEFKQLCLELLATSPSGQASRLHAYFTSVRGPSRGCGWKVAAFLIRRLVASLARCPAGSQSSELHSPSVIAPLHLYSWRPPFYLLHSASCGTQILRYLPLISCVCFQFKSNSVTCLDRSFDQIRRTVNMLKNTS